MDIDEFNFLHLPDQAKAIWEQGKLLGIRYTSDYCIWLYHMDVFYAEAFYDEDLNKVTQVKTFKNQDDLEPYLNHINLKDIKL